MAWEEFGKYMKALATDVKRAVLSMIHPFEIITSGFLSFQRNVLFCNGLRQGSGYLNKLGGNRVFRQTDVSRKLKKPQSTKSIQSSGKCFQSPCILD